MDLANSIYEAWKNNVSGRYRLYLQALLGDRNKPFTANDFTHDELSGLANVIQRAQQSRLETLQQEYEQSPQTRASVQNRMARYQQGLGYVTYADYNTGPYEPDPAFTHDMLGRFNYRLNPDGTTHVTDNYDFNNSGREPFVKMFSTMSPLEKIMSSFGYGDQAIVQHPNMYQIAANLGMAFMGQDKDGRPVDITLPAEPGERKGK